MNPDRRTELGNKSALARIADVISRIARDPGVRDVLRSATQSAGGAIADAWQRNDGPRALVAAVTGRAGNRVDGSPRKVRFEG